MRLHSAVVFGRTGHNYCGRPYAVADQQPCSPLGTAVRCRSSASGPAATSLASRTAT